MKIRELVLEAGPAVGRKYQHIEDLVFTNGSTGGLHAVERLQSMGTQGGTIELKWDGSPVVYWGRDEQGRFSLIPKNAWEYLKRGKTEVSPGVPTAMYSPDDIKNFILGTGKAEPEKEQQRAMFAQGMAELWAYFEKVSPPKGYIEGGILFSPNQPAQLNPSTQEYDFKPNITAFHIPVGSELGKRIAKAKVMVAATGFYDSLGSSEEGRFPNAEQLSTPDVIVQGTTYVEKAPGVEDAGLKKAEQFITANAGLIDGFLAPKPGLSKPGDILYKFYNQNLRIPGVKDKFQAWINANLSAGQAGKILADQRGLNAVLNAVELLSKEKLQLIGKLSAGTHGGIRQTKPEGYVQAHPGTPFKRDLPGQFVKAIDQANWAPRKD
jgi:hypothetical protein